MIIQGFGSRSPSAQARVVWQAPCPAGRQGGGGQMGQRGPVAVVPANYCWKPDCRARKRAPLGRRLTVRDGRRAEGTVATSRVHYFP